jgi:hypothetical protein
MRFLGQNDAKINATAKNNSRSPFDFAQGRLFGMTTKRQGQHHRKNSATDASYRPALARDKPYWMVRVTVAVWMVEPPVAVMVTA